MSTSWEWVRRWTRAAVLGTGPVELAGTGLVGLARWSTFSGTMGLAWRTHVAHTGPVESSPGVGGREDRWPGTRSP